jgi:hypothetical protein
LRGTKSVERVLLGEGEVTEFVGPTYSWARIKASQERAIRELAIGDEGKIVYTSTWLESLKKGIEEASGVATGP